MKFSAGPQRSQDAHIQWDDVFPPTNIRIAIDANAGDPVKLALHELLHLVLYDMHVGRLDETLEEVMIIAYENYIYAYIEASPKRKAEWVRVITKRIDDTTEHLSYEEQVKR